jgi:hypothetical protein
MAKPVQSGPVLHATMGMLLFGSPGSLCREWIGLGVGRQEAISR